MTRSIAGWSFSLYPDAGEGGGSFHGSTRRVPDFVSAGYARDPERSAAEAGRRASAKLRRYCAANRLNRLGTLTYRGDGCHDTGLVRDHLGEFFRADLLVHVQGEEPESPLFPAARGGWLRNRVFRRGWLNAAAASIDEEGLTPHEFRHTAASLAVSAGANVKAVQKMLGHASAAVTLDVYADLFDDDLDAVSVALDLAITKVIVVKMWSRDDLAE